MTRRYRTIIKDVYCPKCDKVTSKVEKKATRGTNRIPGKVCDDCKKKSSALKSKKMKENNPMKKQEVKEKATATLKERIESGEVVYKKGVEHHRHGVPPAPLSEEARLRFSRRMTENNPMKRQEVKEKVANTRKERAKSGEIVYKRGPEHHLWKGGSKYKQRFRSYLYPFWTKLILERENFTCEKCGARNTRLEVHHVTKTYSEIYEEAIDELKISDLESLDDDANMKLLELIIDKHKDVEGMCLCVECHKIVDNQRR